MMCYQKKIKEIEKMNEAEKDREDVRVVYQAILDDIKLYKNQQWLTTYYVFGLYIAITSVLFELKDIHCFEKWGLIFIVCLVMLTGVVLLLINKKDLENARENKRRVIKKSIVFKQILDSDKRDFTSLISWILIWAMLLGGLFVIYIICRFL